MQNITYSYFLADGQPLQQSYEEEQTTRLKTTGTHTSRKNLKNPHSQYKKNQKMKLPKTKYHSLIVLF